MRVRFFKMGPRSLESYSDDLRTVASRAEAYAMLSALNMDGYVTESEPDVLYTRITPNRYGMMPASEAWQENRVVINDRPRPVPL